MASEARILASGGGLGVGEAMHPKEGSFWLSAESKTMWGCFAIPLHEYIFIRA